MGASSAEISVFFFFFFFFFFFLRRNWGDISFFFRAHDSTVTNMSLASTASSPRRTENWWPPDVVVHVSPSCKLRLTPPTLTHGAPIQRAKTGLFFF